jgi:hypothetical protein
LALLNSTGSTLQSSTNGGTNNETINATVTAGTYYARVYPRNNNAFNASSCYTLKVQTGTASRNNGTDIFQFSNKEITIFPNPGAYNVSMSFNAKASGTSEITVTNLMGSVVLRKNITVTEGENNRKLDVSILSNGIYLVQVKTGTDSQTAKLVINK